MRFPIAESASIEPSISALYTPPGRPGRGDVSLAMSGFADLLDERRASILERFVARVPSSFKDGLTRSELVDHLPQLLTEIAQALRSGGWPAAAALMEGSPAGATHGRQRLRIGFSLDAVEIQASVHDLRALTAALTGALAESVAEHTAASLAQRELVEERYRMLFETIADGYCLMQMIVDANGKTVDYRFLEVNDAFEGQTGLVVALGKTARELVPDLDGSWFERYGRVAATGEASSFESHAPAPSGGARHQGHHRAQARGGGAGASPHARTRGAQRGGERELPEGRVPRHREPRAAHPAQRDAGRGADSPQRHRRGREARPRPGDASATRARSRSSSRTCST